jgi:peptide/nickel transport system substrate-binding protein
VSVRGPARFAAAVLAASSLLAGCGGRPGGAADPPRRGGTLVIGSISDVDAWNEYIAQQSLAVNLLRRIELRLAQENGDTRDHPPTFEPLLASGWTLSPDGLTLTFTLRDATWSDGVPITADDVRFTWRAQTSPDVGWAGATFKEHIKDVVAEGPRTVSFRFDRAYPEMLADAVEGGILPRHVCEWIPFASWRTYDWSSQRVGSGPFLLESWRPGEEIVLRRNPRYFASGSPRVDAVDVRIVPDIGNLETQLLAGSIDLVDGVPPADAQRLASTHGITLVAYDNPMFDYIGWNASEAPFGDPDVRRALTLAINRTAIVEDLLYGYGRVSSGPLLSSWWPADPSLKPWPFDPAEASRILRTKGFGPNHPLAFDLSTNAGNRLREEVTVKVQEQLSRIGVVVTPRTYEMKAFRERNVAGHYDAYVAGWRFSGKLDLKALFGSGSIPPNGLNVVFYRSEAADRLLDAIGAAPDWRAAKPGYARLARQLHEDQPYTFLYEGRRIMAVGPRARGVSVDVPADPFARLERFELNP